MRWNDKRKKKQLLNLIERLKKENIVILVEGKKDINSLRDIGIKNRIIKVSDNQKPLFSLVEDIKKRWEEAIILTDWDKHGDELSKKLSRLLERNGVKPNDY